MSTMGSGHRARVQLRNGDGAAGSGLAGSRSKAAIHRQKSAKKRLITEKMKRVLAMRSECSAREGQTQAPSAQTRLRRFSSEAR